jgi:hypothetical protein
MQVEMPVEANQLGSHSPQKIPQPADRGEEG